MESLETYAPDASNTCWSSSNFGSGATIRQNNSQVGCSVAWKLPAVCYTHLKSFFSMNPRWVWIRKPGANSGRRSQNSTKTKQLPSS